MTRISSVGAYNMNYSNCGAIKKQNGVQNGVSFAGNPEQPKNNETLKKVLKGVGIGLGALLLAKLAIGAIVVKKGISFVKGVGKEHNDISNTFASKAQERFNTVGQNFGSF